MDQVDSLTRYPDVTPTERCGDFRETGFAESAGWWQARGQRCHGGLVRSLAAGNPFEEVEISPGKG